MLGVIAIGERAFATGVRLVNAATVHVPLPDLLATDRAEMKDSIATARSALSEETYARIWAEGKAMTLDQATACALDGDESAHGA